MGLADDREGMKLRFWIEYLLLRTVGFVAAILPRPLAIGLVKGLGVIAFDVFRTGRSIALANLRDAFPDFTPGRRRRIARASLANLAVVGMEMLRSRWRRPERVLKLVDLDPESDRLYRDLMEQGRGVVFVGGHYCNWELLGARIAASGYPAVAVAQDQRNPLINREIDTIRNHLGIRLVHRGTEVRQLIGVLRSGGAVMLLADQETRPGYGIFADFFGKPAWTFKGPATFAARYRIPLLAASIHRRRGRYRARYDRLDNCVLAGLPPGADEAMRIRCLTDAFNAWLEELITRDPYQYLWLHRRWEHWPVGTTP